MIHFYYYLVLMNALVAWGVGVTVLLKNRYGWVGPSLGAAMLVLAIWLACFAQYFTPMSGPHAILWARFTLTAAIILQPLLLQSFCTLCDKGRPMRWWIVASYVSAVGAVYLLWRYHVITGLRHPPFMDNYVIYNRLLGAHLTFWQLLGAGVMIHTARHAVGYKRTQLIYFAVVWSVAFLTAHMTILPLDYNINIHRLVSLSCHAT